MYFSEYNLWIAFKIVTPYFPGLRFINCKSGKDRTGMAASLEQIQILSREYDLAEHEYQKALDAMRRLVTSAM